jgi:hypothetical protein
MARALPRPRGRRSQSRGRSGRGVHRRESDPRGPQW